MSSSNKDIGRIIFIIFTGILLPLPHINENLFFFLVAIFHIMLCGKIVSQLPEKCKVIKLLCFVFLLGLVQFSINGLNGLSSGLMQTIQEYETIPLLYQRIGEEITMIPLAIIKRDINVFTPHFILLGMAGIFSLGRYLWISRGNS